MKLPAISTPPLQERWRQMERKGWFSTVFKLLHGRARLASFPALQLLIHYTVLWVCWKNCKGSWSILESSDWLSRLHCIWFTSRKDPTVSNRRLSWSQVIEIKRFCLIFKPISNFKERERDNARWSFKWIIVFNIKKCSISVSSN